MKLTEKVSGRLDADSHQRLQQALATLERSESYAIRKAVLAYLPVLEAEAAALRSPKPRKRKP